MSIALTRNFSIEATRPSPMEIEAVAGILERDSEVYLSAVPTQTFTQHVELAAQVRRAGLQPVVHVSARRLAGEAELANFLARLRAEADVSRVLVIAGDSAVSGPFQDALAVIRSGALQRAGIGHVGIAGYPEGHATIAPDLLEATLRDKIAAAAEGGLGLQIVSQFSFSPDNIVGWLKRLRAAGISAPVKVGMAGPTSIPALLRYAKRCGVNASLKGLMSGAAASLLAGSVGPDRIIKALADAGDEIGDAAPHYFSFGGVAETARYARETARDVALADKAAAAS